MRVKFLAQGKNGDLCRGFELRPDKHPPITSQTLTTAPMCVDCHGAREQAEQTIYSTITTCIHIRN